MLAISFSILVTTSGVQKWKKLYTLTSRVVTLCKLVKNTWYCVIHHILALFLSKLYPWSSLLNATGVHLWWILCGSPVCGLQCNYSKVGQWFPKVQPSRFVGHQLKVAYVHLSDHLQPEQSHEQMWRCLGFPRNSITCVHACKPTVVVVLSIHVHVPCCWCTLI